MKIRNGFVSNSSSSSFIIAYNKDVEKCLEFMQEYVDDFVFTNIFDGQELKSYILEKFYDIYNEKIEKRIYEKAKQKVLKENKKIGYITCSKWFSKVYDLPFEILYNETE